MRSAITSTLIVSSLGLAVLSGCGRRHPSACPNPVEIDITMVSPGKCTAKPDPAPVNDTCQVFWKPDDGNTYTVDFKGFNPIGGPISDSLPHPANGDWSCKHLSIDCYYAYKITQGNNAPCADPGIRVTP
jgi:hypothetical protein